MSLSNSCSLISLENCPFSLDWLPSNTCLVGGAVRDALLDHQKDYLDLDFVLPELAIETAQKIASHYRAGFVILDKQRQIARVVFPEGTVDFALQEGDSIERDLQRRDFTINAIAYDPRSGESIDPLGGLKDLREGILRMVSAKNLQDDPLRLLRAYRQAAQLNFAIEPKTRNTIRSLAPLLGKVAPERIQTELGYLLAIPQGDDWLFCAWEDGVLNVWLKNLSREKLQQVEQVERAVQYLEIMLGKEKFRQLIPDSEENLKDKYIQIAKLASLVDSNSEAAEAELKRLKYSRYEVRMVTTALKAIATLETLCQPMSLRDEYFFFLQVKEVFPLVAILAIAKEIDREILKDPIHHYCDPNALVAHPRPLVTGHDLIESLGIAPSPVVGQLLTELQIAHVEGKIATVDEAIAFARVLVNLEGFSKR